MPNANSTTPVSEAQVRPLLRLAEPAQRTQAWITAVDKVEGRQPTAVEVSEVVFEILSPEGRILRDTSAVRAKRRVELVARLRESVRRKSWKEIERILAELEDLL